MSEIQEEPQEGTQPGEQGPPPGEESQPAGGEALQPGGEGSQERNEGAEARKEAAQPRSEGRGRGEGSGARVEGQGPRGEGKGSRGEGHPPRAEGQDSRGEGRGGRSDRPEGRSDRGDSRGGRDRDSRGSRSDRRDMGRRGEGPTEIDLDRLIADSLYLDNQAHSVVSRMRDLDSGTKSQLRRLYNSIRRACRTPEGDRQHEFVMLRARLAYTIARHSLRSLDSLERLLLQVTRKNEMKGYERFRDLFEAIIAYNE